MTAKAQRIGVLGTGRQAREHRIPSFLAIADQEKVEIVGVADVNLNAAHDFVRSLGRRGGELDAIRARGYDVSEDVARRFSSVPVHGSLENMLHAQPLDGVVIVVPHDLHASTAIEAMEHDCHVLGEKPMATEPQEWDAMARVAGERGRVLGVGYQVPNQLDPVREMIAAGELGRITGGRFTWVRESGIPGDAHFWADPSTGGVRLDLGGHGASALLSFFDSEPQVVRARTDNTFGVERFGADFRADDTAEIQIRFADGRTGEIKVSWALGLPPDEEAFLDLYDEDGMLHAPVIAQKSAEYQPDPGAFPIVRRREGATEPTLVGPPTLVYTEAMVAQARNWTRACRGDAELALPVPRAVAAERVVHAAGISAPQPGGGWGPWVNVG